MQEPCTRWAYHHPHTNTTVDGIHEDVELICPKLIRLNQSRCAMGLTKTAYGTTDRLPQREK